MEHPPSSLLSAIISFRAADGDVSNCFESMHGNPSGFAEGSQKKFGNYGWIRVPWSGSGNAQHRIAGVLSAVAQRRGVADIKFRCS